LVIISYFCCHVDAKTKAGTRMSPWVDSHDLSLPAFFMPLRQ
jgi:hypothetical protein